MAADARIGTSVDRLAFSIPIASLTASSWPDIGERSDAVFDGYARP